MAHTHTFEISINGITIEGELEFIPTGSNIKTDNEEAMNNIKKFLTNKILFR